MSEHALKIDNVSFRYRSSERWILRNVSLAVDLSELIVVRGENGAGKTTLLNLVADLFTPSSGSIHFHGNAMSTYRSKIALVAAEFDMFPYLSIEDNIRFFLEFYGIYYDERELEELLHRYSLLEFRSKLAHSASRGMRRKTQIIASLLQSPAILLADEPFDGLDQQAQDALRRDLITFVQNGGIAMVVSHDRGVTKFLPSRVFELSAPIGALSPLEIEA